VDLQGALLAHGLETEETRRALAIAGEFHAYLCELQSKLAARDYSELASRLDIGAVGAVALENVVAGERDKFWQRLTLGGLGESLMVAASRQYIKAWQTEVGQVHNCAAWGLAGQLWQASLQMKPELPVEQRWQAIQALLAPAHDDQVPGAIKAVLLGRIFQMMLATYLARLLPQSQEGAQ